MRVASAKICKVSAQRVMAEIRNRIAAILSRMKYDTLEREEALALSLLSALAGESIFLLGLPGVGKSMIARRLKLAFDKATVFEYLMSRFSTPDEIFGPVSISKLKDEDCYERVTSGFLPEAEVVFLDEIWKAGPAIQNTLLTVLNEKIYLNGNSELQLPLKGIIAASNELPAKNEGLEALWDRFLLRYIVDPIKHKQNFFKLLSVPTADLPMEEFEPLSHDEFLSVQAESRKVAISEGVIEILYTIREKLNERINAKDVVTGEADPDNLKYYVSDRRWKKAVGVMKTSAYLNGRSEIGLSDLLLLSHMLWNDERSIPVVRQIIAEAVVASLFSHRLERYKSSKRHVSVEGNGTRLYTPDREHYIIQCDDSPLKIKIKDYRRMQASPDDLFFGSETTDGILMIRRQGQFVMRFVKEGVICINNYNYSLSTESVDQLSNDFIAEIGDNVHDIANRLYTEMNQNLFIANSDLYKPIQDVVAIYRTRIDLM